MPLITNAQNILISEAILSQTCPLWSICQFASTGRAPWGRLLVISLCLTGLSLDQGETNVFRSASTSPPCHRPSLVKRCFSANVAPIAPFMSTSSCSQRRAVFRDLPVDTQKKSPTKYLISPPPQTFHQKIEANTDEHRVCSPPFKCSDSASLYLRRTRDLTVCTAVHANAYDALSFLLILIKFWWQGKLWSSKSFCNQAYSLLCLEKTWRILLGSI